MVVDYVIERGALSRETAISLNDVADYIRIMNWDEKDIGEFGDRIVADYLMVEKENDDRWVVYKPLLSPTENCSVTHPDPQKPPYIEEIIDFFVRNDATSPNKTISVSSVKRWMRRNGMILNKTEMEKLWVLLGEYNFVVRKMGFSQKSRRDVYYDTKVYERNLEKYKKMGLL